MALYTAAVDFVPFSDVVVDGVTVSASQDRLAVPSQQDAAVDVVR